MSVRAVEVRAQPSIDPEAVKSTLSGAETAFQSCLETDGSTGVLALKFPIERDGSVGDVTELAASTYGGEESRICIERIIAAMRFPTFRARGDVEVILEIRTRQFFGD